MIKISFNQFHTFGVLGWTNFEYL